MAARLIDGKTLAAAIREKTVARAAALRAAGRPACLACVLVGEDAAARTYAASQAKDAASVGVEYRLVELSAASDMGGAYRAIGILNADAAVSGIILQLPLPQHLDAFLLQQEIAPAKDVEGVNATNLGLLAMGRKALVPCTAAAALACLESTGVELAGREAVVVGRSAIVGKPLSMLLLARHATVTQCHTRTSDLAAHTRHAEILMVAAGKAGLIGAEHVSPGAIVIDVGIHRVKDSGPDGKGRTKTIGDVRFDEVAPIAGAITPVPGGVGPVTVAMLLANTVEAAERGSD